MHRIRLDTILGVCAIHVRSRIPGRPPPSTSSGCPLPRQFHSLCGASQDLSPVRPSQQLSWDMSADLSEGVQPSRTQRGSVSRGEDAQCMQRIRKSLRHMLDVSGVGMCFRNNIAMDSFSLLVWLKHLHHYPHNLHYHSQTPLVIGIVSIATAILIIKLSPVLPLRPLLSIAMFGIRCDRSLLWAVPGDTGPMAPITIGRQPW